LITIRAALKRSSNELNFTILDPKISELVLRVQLCIAKGEQSGLQMHIAVTASVSLCAQMTS